MTAHTVTPGTTTGRRGAQHLHSPPAQPTCVPPLPNTCRKQGRANKLGTRATRLPRFRLHDSHAGCTHPLHSGSGWGPRGSRPGAGTIQSKQRAQGRRPTPQPGVSSSRGAGPAAQSSKENNNSRASHAHLATTGRARWKLRRRVMRERKQRGPAPTGRGTPPGLRHAAAQQPPSTAAPA